MPVIVVGGDTPTGTAIVAALLKRGGEVRSFVTDPVAGADHRAQGARAAIGDLSDGSHIGAAAYQAFTAVLVEAAATDGRPLAFAADQVGVLSTWSAALRDAGVTRAIWVGSRDPSLIEGGAPEVAVVDPSGRADAEVAEEVADLNDRANLKPET